MKIAEIRKFTAIPMNKRKKHTCTLFTHKHKHCYHANALTALSMITPSVKTNAVLSDKNIRWTPSCIMRKKAVLKWQHSQSTDMYNWI